MTKTEVTLTATQIDALFLLVQAARDASGTLYDVIANAEEVDPGAVRQSYRDDAAALSAALERVTPVMNDIRTQRSSGAEW
jgi:hypothetical protein